MRPIAYQYPACVPNALPYSRSRRYRGSARKNTFAIYSILSKDKVIVPIVNMSRTRI